MKDKPVLQTSEQHRDLILLAEIGALIHDLGKLSAEFIAVKAQEPPDGPGWWKSDAHAEVAKLHSSCVIPAFLAPYFERSTKAIDMDAVRRRGVEMIGNAIRDELAIVGGDLCDVLTSRVEGLLGRAKSVEDVTSRFGQLRQQLEDAIRERRYRKDQAVQAMTELERAWGRIETACKEFLAELRPLQEHESRLSREQQVSDDFLSEALRQALMTESALVGETVRLKDFLELHHRDHWQIPWLLHLLRAAVPDREDKETQTARREPEGCDGLDSAIDKQLARKEGEPQEFGQSMIATAFGHEAQRLPVGPDEDGLKVVRDNFAKLLANALSQVRDGHATPAQVRPCILKAAETAFRQALGETRRAANDVTLWDHSYSVASLYKAALAKVLLERAIFGEGYKLPAPADIGWRFLRVGVDGLRFFAQAHHVTDILGRRRALVDALDQVRQALEVDYPLGNEVYRDENGSVFVMPGLADEDAHKQLAQEIKKLVLEAFRQAELGEELVPRVTWNNRDKGPVRKEMTIAFGQLVAQKPPPLTSAAQAMRDWWEDPQARGKEICTVCGVRPIGYDIPKFYGSSKEQIAYYLEAADERKVCGPCLDRRGKRAQAWVTGPTEFQRTIWTDEVADNNARFALVVGRFGLEGWLDGTLVKTMLVAPGKEKNPSPARVRRCWDTTRQFWLDLVESHDGKPPELERIVTSRPFRLRINPANAAELNKALGAYHVYDWPLRGGVTLSVVWVPDGKEGGYFLSADNLWYLAGPEQLAFPEEALKDDFRLLYEFSRVINGQVINSQREVALLEPSGYGRPAEVRASVRLPQEGGVTWHPDSAYTPYIPILAEPATFMALVPADRALEVAKAIAAKYDREMARVRDRLPLHLGLVFAPRRTPLAAVLEAGQAMLKMSDAWEEWEVVGKKITEKTLDDGRRVPAEATLYLRPACRGINPPAEGPKGAEVSSASRLQPASPSQPDDSSSGDDRARVTWHYPLLMGDNQTSDGWYPHLLLHEPNKRLEEKRQQGLVPQGEELTLKKQDGDFAFVSESDLTGTVFIRPSRFDFEFLDTTARRFEITYQTSEASETSEVSRPSRRTRPFLLDDLDRLENLWREEFCYLKKSQRHQVIATIEATREAWFGDDRKGKSLTDSVFRQFVHDTLAGATWPRGHEWHQMDQNVRKQLEDAGVTGELADLAELYMQILKE